jgi:hypothetical protein
MQLLNTTEYKLEIKFYQKQHKEHSTKDKTMVKCSIILSRILNTGLRNLL